ncbi:MAG: PD-(D/E)XK nuclease domain-containing protein, partial [Prevotellaceae bacterium]|nr:PD-(D/E)XK nuclease domain-containing protein [Prevotellaceae bacterium]
HAPRQTGKTTFLLSWMREINAGGEAVSCYVSVERCQGVAEPERAMPSICDAIREYTSMLRLAIPDTSAVNANSMLSDMLIRWSALVAPKPLVVLFDEVDVLTDDVMVSFLRQLRGGFASRGVGLFPVSIALVGMRDLKDYTIKAKDGKPVNPGSPFNIKEDSAMLGNFTKGDVARLFAQRTAETGQQITPEALGYVYEQSQGQPWIVNSLFMRATLRVLDGESTETVTLAHVEEARQQMVAARETHLDSLGERLRDPRIRRVIEFIITGDVNPNMGRTNPDVELAMDLGLVSWSNSQGFTIANPIYEEILTRFLNSGYHDNLPPPSSWQWQKPDGTLDMDSLLREFQSFWQANSEAWEEMSSYSEAFPHLLLMAFLQRVTNGEGRIEREYAAGRGRMDLALLYKGKRHIIEVKLLRSRQSLEKVRELGVQQILRYRDRFSPPLGGGAPPGCYLLIFDRRPEAAQRSWSERLRWSQEGEVTVVEC